MSKFNWKVVVSIGLLVSTSALGCDPVVLRVDRSHIAKESVLWM